MSKSGKSAEMDVCADCGQPDPTWASINHGVLVCDQCAIIHRSLGRFISQLKSLRAGNWRQSQLQMVYDLYHNGSNSIWEHTLLDPHTFSPASGGAGGGGSLIKSFSSSSSSHHANDKKKKPSPNDPLTPHKADFIRAKYQTLAFVNKSHSISKEDEAETESDISEQLHSSVRTPNLKTSLRLLAAGANPNYIHSEKFNSPLHLASKSGQMSQVELLLIYGANISVVDAHGRTPIDYAREAGHQEIVYRLVEHQFDLPDRLTCFICQGRQPNHRNGEHFLIIDIKPEFLNFFPFPPETEKHIANTPAMNVYRSELYQNIQALSNGTFHELTRDVYDEIDRREVNAFVARHYATNDSGKIAANHQQLIVPFLPVYQFFTSTRNQGRQKLALLNVKEFTLLIIDILNEIRQRIYGLGTCQDIKNSIYSNASSAARFQDDFDDDSEPLYDSVPSEGDDYDECNELLTPEEENGGGAVIGKNKSGPPVAKKPSSLSITKSTATPSTTTTKVTSDEYCTMKEQITSLIKQEFMNENREMRDEITRLHSMVERLLEENVQLRQLLLTQKTAPEVMTMVHPAPPALLSTQVLQSDFKSNSVLVIDGVGGDPFSRNSFLRTSNRIRPQSSLSCNNGSTNNVHHNNETNHISMQSPASVINYSSNAHYYTGGGSSNSNNSIQMSPGVLSSGGANSIFIAPPGGNTSMHSSQQQLYSSNSVSGGGGSPSLQHRQFGGSTLQTSNSFNRGSTPPLPSKEDVIRKIEFITDGIKELLGNAREGRHEKFQLCSQRIRHSVSDMINLFPESLSTSKSIGLVQLHQALSSLNVNTMRLHEECASMHHECFNNNNSSSSNIYAPKPASGQDYRHIYGNIIDKAAEVASSVKNIVTFYNC